MKLSRSVFLLLATSFFAQADSVWAPGVTLEGGWVDYNKVDGSTYDTDDSGMCWAATASNVIAWWQTQNQASLSGVTLPNDEPWDVFRILTKNNGGNPRFAYDWWINGGSSGNLSWDAEQKTAHGDWAAGGFLKDVYDTAMAPVFIANSNNRDVYTKASALVGALNAGYALSIEVGTNDGGSSHAITLWGLEYHLDEQERFILDYAYITDSDTGYGLTKAQFEEYEKGVLILKSTTTGTGNSYNFNRADGMNLYAFLSLPGTLQWSSATQGDQTISARDVEVFGVANVGNLIFEGDSIVSGKTDDAALGGSGTLTVKDGHVVFDTISRKDSSGNISIAAGATLELKNGAQILSADADLSATNVTVAGTLKLESFAGLGKLAVLDLENGALVELMQSDSSAMSFHLKGASATLSIAEGQKFTWSGGITRSDSNNTLVLQVGKDATLDLQWISALGTVVDLTAGGKLLNSNSYMGTIKLAVNEGVATLTTEQLSAYGGMSSLLSAKGIKAEISDMFYAQSGTMKTGDNEESIYLSTGRMQAQKGNVHIAGKGQQDFYLKDFHSQYGAISAFGSEPSEGDIIIEGVGKVEVTGNKVTDAQAKRGGAFTAFGGVSISATGDIDLSRNAASNGSSAGAIYTENGNVSIQSSQGGITLSENSGMGDGGAIASDGNVDITPGEGAQVQIVGNTAEGSGGAIYAQGKVTLRGGAYEVSSNTSGNEGGAIYASSVEIAADKGDIIFAGNRNKDAANDIALIGGSASLAATSGHELELQGGITGAGEMDISADELSTVRLGGYSSAKTLRISGGTVEGIPTVKDRAVLCAESVVLSGARLQDITLAGNSAAAYGVMLLADSAGASFTGTNGSSYLFSDASLLTYGSDNGTLTATATTPVLSGFSTIEGSLELGISLDFIKAILQQADGTLANVQLTLVAGALVGKEGFDFELDAATREWLAGSDATAYGFYDEKGTLLGADSVHLNAGGTANVVFGVSGITKTIPEPTSAALSLLALAGLALRRRRR